MDLWIRSQSKEMLFKVNNNLIIRYNYTVGMYFIECDNHKIAMYKTKRRALEVLEEIQNILVGAIIIKSNAFLSPSDQEKLRERFKTDTLPIIEQPSYEIKPLQNFIVYKMPEE